MLSTANKTCSGYPDKRSEKKRKSSEDKSKPLYVAYLLRNPLLSCTFSSGISSK